MLAIIDSYKCPLCDLEKFSEGFIIERYVQDIRDGKEFIIFSHIGDKTRYKICRRHTEFSDYNTEQIIRLLKDLIISVTNKQKDKELNHELRCTIHDILYHTHKDEE